MASPEFEALNNIDWADLGTQLQSARKAVSKTQDEVAALLGVARTTVVAIEQGKRRLNSGELIRLADMYGLDLTRLLKTKPSPDNLSVLLRARFERRLFDLVGESPVERAVADLQKYAEEYVELETLLDSPLPRRYPVPYDYAGMAVDVAADEVAKQERVRLNLGDGPLINLRGLLEAEVGLRIFYLDLPSQVAGMFGYTESLGGCISINRGHPPDRQRMTLAHEYAHFLTTRTTAEIQILHHERDPEPERFANFFASRFLLPESGVRRQLRAHLQSTKSFTLGDLLRLARYYGVSYEAFGTRLEELELIPQGTTERFKQGGLKVRTAQEVVGLEPEKNNAMLPERYKLLAVRAFEEDEITEGQLMHYLGAVSRLEARRTVEELKNQLGVDEQGRPVSTSFPVEEPLSLRSR